MLWALQVTSWWMEFTQVQHQYEGHTCTIHPCAERTSGDHVLVTLMEFTQVKCAALDSISDIRQLTSHSYKSNNTVTWLVDQPLGHPNFRGELDTTTSAFCHQAVNDEGSTGTLCLDWGVFDSCCLPASCWLVLQCKTLLHDVYSLQRCLFPPQWGGCEGVDVRVKLWGCKGEYVKGWVRGEAVSVMVRCRVWWCDVECEGVM